MHVASRIRILSWLISNVKTGLPVLPAWAAILVMGVPVGKTPYNNLTANATTGLVPVER